MRVCNHGCNVTLSVSPAHFKAVSLTLKYKYYGIQMKNTFPSFDLEIDHLFPSEPRKESKRKKNNSACVSNLDDLLEGAQAKGLKTTKYATKYAVNVFKVIFAFNYYNKILKITYCFLKKMYNKIKRELYATDCECFEIKFYTTDRLPCLAVKCSKNEETSSRHI